MSAATPNCPKCNSPMRYADGNDLVHDDTGLVHCSGTPLTDSVAIEFPFPTASDRQFVVHADNCRAIEERLNTCVTALETYLMAGHKDARRVASIVAKGAIALAKEPLV